MFSPKIAGLENLNRYHYNDGMLVANVYISFPIHMDENQILVAKIGQALHFFRGEF